MNYLVILVAVTAVFVGEVYFQPKEDPLIRVCYQEQRVKILKCYSEDKNFLACESAYKGMCK